MGLESSLQLLCISVGFWLHYITNDVDEDVGEGIELCMHSAAIEGLAHTAWLLQYRTEQTGLRLLGMGWDGMTGRWIGGMEENSFCWASTNTTELLRYYGLCM